MCNPDTAPGSEIPSNYEFNGFQSNITLTNIVGISISGAPIFTAPSPTSVDALYPLSWPGYTGETTT